MAKPHKTPATDADWKAAELRIRNFYASEGIPQHMIPTRPPRHGGMISDVNQYFARARGGMRAIRFRAMKNGQLIKPWGGLDRPHDVPDEEPVPPWVNAGNFQAWLRAMADQQIANIKAQGEQGVAQWGALENNPALWQQMRAREMGPFADFFWNQFPQQMNDIGNIIGDQLNMNAERVSAMTMARGEDDRKRDALRDTLATLEKIYGGFSGALESGFGSIGEGLGQFGQGFSPLGGASGVFGAGGGGGFRILPDGSVVTAQDFSNAIPQAGQITGGAAKVGPIAGVNAAAANELGQIARGAGRQAAGRIRGQFDAKAARQGDAARAGLMGAGAQANQGQLANALLTAKGVNKNILSNANAQATVQKANDKARAARGKQFSGLVGQLGGLLPGLG